MSPAVGNWVDTPALKRLLETHELAAWEVTEGRVVVRLRRERDGTVTFRSLSDIPVPAPPELAESITGGLSDRARGELLAGRRAARAVSGHTSSGPLRARVS